MKREAIMSHPRFAGQLLRYHTWPVHRSQSVGEHTWQVLRIYFRVFGIPTQDVFCHILWHDAGELHTGDIPFPFKSLNPVVKDRLDAAENNAVAQMGGYTVPLEGKDHIRFKMCDLLEMHEYGLTEEHMGNQFAEGVTIDTLGHVLSLARSPDMRPTDWVRVVEYLKELHSLFDVPPKYWEDNGVSYEA